jgi:hypothetical protein
MARPKTLSPAKKKAAKPKRASRISPALTFPDEVGEILVGPPATAITTVPATLGEQLRARDWVAVAGGGDPAEILARMHLAVQDALALPEQNGLKKVKPWTQVLADAGVPWLAWRLMETDVQGMRDLYESWAAGIAQQVAVDAVMVLDDVIPLVSSKDDGPLVAATVASANNRKWLAERLDPRTWAQTNKLVGQVAHKVEIVVRDE